MNSLFKDEKLKNFLPVIILLGLAIVVSISIASSPKVVEVLTVEVGAISHQF